MVIYDPPSAEQDERVWREYLSSLDRGRDAEEVRRTTDFIEARFSSGMTLEEYAIAHLFGE